MILKDFVNLSWNEIIFNAKIIPNSTANQFIWPYWDWLLKFKIKWIPEKGKVNRELINFISNELNISISKISIIKWETSTSKVIKVDLF